MIKCFEPACWDVAEPMDGRVLQKLLQALHLWMDYYSLHQNAQFENLLHFYALHELIIINCENWEFEMNLLMGTISLSHSVGHFGVHRVSAQFFLAHIHYNVHYTWTNYFHLYILGLSFAAKSNFVSTQKENYLSSLSLISFLRRESSFEAKWSESCLKASYKLKWKLLKGVTNDWRLRGCALQLKLISHTYESDVEFVETFNQVTVTL